MIERRNCAHVIHEMLKFIPEEQREFKQALLWNYDDATYKAPEETIQWVRTSEILQKFIPKPTEDWHFEILSIFTTEPIDKLKKYVEEDL